MKRTTRKKNIYQNYQRNLISATVSTNVGINNQERLINEYGSDVSRIEILNVLKRQSKFTICWFIIFFALGITCLVLDLDGWFNVLDLFVVMFNIYLIAKGKVIGIVIGIIECFLYAYIAYKTQLFGEVIKVLAISVPLNFITLINWLRTKKKQKSGKKYNSNNNQSEDVKIRKLSKKLIFIYLLLAITITIGGYFFLKYALGQTTALILGAISLTIMIIGKILTAQQYMDSYIVFLLGDLICLAMWIQTLITTPFAIPTVTMLVYYTACFTNDTFGYFSWKDMYRQVAINGGVLLAMRDIKINKIAKVKRQFKGLHWNKEIDISKNS